MNKEDIKTAAKLNYLRSKVEGWALSTIAQKVPASVKFDGIRVTIDDFDKTLDPSCDENSATNSKPIRFSLMSQWNRGGTGSLVGSETLIEAAIEVANAFVWCLKERSNSQHIDAPIDDLEYIEEPAQLSLAF